MNQRHLIPVLGVALLVGLYIYDRDDRTDIIISAEVLSLEDQDNEAGPDSWHLMVRIGDKDFALETLEKRPVVAAGHTICVTKTLRAAQPDTYRYSPSTSC